jgi:hypothetical protein
MATGQVSRLATARSVDGRATLDIRHGLGRAQALACGAAGLPEANGDDFRRDLWSASTRAINRTQESVMTATYTFDVFSSLDGYGSHSGGNWGGYWGKQGPELLDRRLAVYDAGQRDGLRGHHLSEFRATAGPEHRGDPTWVIRGSLG